MSATCPWCQAPRALGPSCPKCGADYAKAEAIKSKGRAPAAPPPAANAAPAETAGAPAASSIQYLPSDEPDDVEDAQREWILCAAALPAMLAVAVLFNAWELGRFLQRTFLTMPVHELGHAATAWLCGYAAIPTLWHTNVPEERGFFLPLLLLGAAAFLAWRGWRAGRWWLAALGIALAALALAGRLAASEKTSQMLITFGGDGMGMAIAAALMTTFFYGKGTQLYRGGLRWGFLAIGAAAFVDMFATWVAARRDHGRIPFGEQEGGLLSDATRLVDEFGWSTEMLTGRYLWLGIACLLALLAVYAWGVWQARQDLNP